MKYFDTLTERFSGALFFVAFVVLIAFLVPLLGCNAENPLCSTNFCAVGEVFPRSELGDREFSEVDIDDSVIFATFTGATPSPVEKISVDVNITETDVLTVTNSLKNDEPTFKGAFISVNAIVDRYGTNGDSLHLRTRSGDPKWTIRMFVKDYHFDISRIFPKNGTSLNMILWVSDFENNTVFCRAVDPANIASGRSVLHQSVSVINTSVADVVQSMKNGESFFIFKKISITAPVIDFRRVKSEHLGKEYEFIDLIERESDIFNNKENHTFKVYPNARLYEEFNQDYVIGAPYRFELIVHYLSGGDFFDPKDIGVVTHLAE